MRYAVIAVMCVAVLAMSWHSRRADSSGMRPIQVEKAAQSRLPEGRRDWRLALKE